MTRTQLKTKEQLIAKLKAMNNIGKLVEAKRKDDPLSSDIIGMVMDEVSVLVGDTRYWKQRICTSGFGGFPKGVNLYRYGYHTVPGKITSNTLYFGQYGPWHRTDVDGELQTLAQRKWGACGMPFENC